MVVASDEEGGRESQVDSDIGRESFVFVSSSSSIELLSGRAAVTDGITEGRFIVPLPLDREFVAVGVTLGVAAALCWVPLSCGNESFVSSETC